MMTHQQEIATPDIRRKSCKVRSQKLEFGTTRWLTYCAVFAALSIVMKIIGQYLTITPSFRITLIYVIWLISGAVLGPLGGGVVCFTSDVLGALVVPMGPINPFITIANTFYGVTAAFAFRFTPVKNYVVKFISSGIVCTIVFTCLLNSLALYYTYGYNATLTFWQYFAAYRAFQPLVAAINVGVTVTMIPLLIRLKLLPSPKKKDINHSEENK